MTLARREDVGGGARRWCKIVRRRRGRGRGRERRGRHFLGNCLLLNTRRAVGGEFDDGSCFAVATAAAAPCDIATLSSPFSYKLFPFRVSTSSVLESNIRIKLGRVRVFFDSACSSCRCLSSLSVCLHIGTLQSLHALYHNLS